MDPTVPKREGFIKVAPVCNKTLDLGRYSFILAAQHSPADPLALHSQGAPWSIAVIGILERLLSVVRLHRMPQVQETLNVVSRTPLKGMRRKGSNLTAARKSERGQDGGTRGWLVRYNENTGDPSHLVALF